MATGNDIMNAFAKAYPNLTKFMGAAYILVRVMFLVSIIGAAASWNVWLLAVSAGVVIIYQIIRWRFNVIFERFRDEYLIDNI